MKILIFILLLAHCKKVASTTEPDSQPRSETKSEYRFDSFEVPLGSRGELALELDLLAQDLLSPQTLGTPSCRAPYSGDSIVATVQCLSGEGKDNMQKLLAANVTQKCAAKSTALKPTQTFQMEKCSNALIAPTRPGLSARN